MPLKGKRSKETDALEAGSDRAQSEPTLQSWGRALHRLVPFLGQDGAAILAMLSVVPIGTLFDVSIWILAPLVAYGITAYTFLTWRRLGEAP
jgi:hypothetical protein